MLAKSLPLRPYASVYFEGAFLLVVTPFLLFPAIAPLLTAVSLSIFYLIRPPQPSPFNVSWLVWWLLVSVAVLVTADPDLTLPEFMG
ncbi:MAG: hypothetical protein GWP17_05235, partial [Aquificales bacterium]|nr:hypothetical protein [Aquificales bacterium]